MMFKVFISGNQGELGRERKAVKDVILNTGVFRQFFEVFTFEDVPAEGKDPASRYLSEVKNSDIYLGILGSEYGLKGEGGLSPTEKEFETFLKSVPSGEVLIFIKGITSVDRDEDTENFINKIRESFVYRRFDSLEDLKHQVTYSLEQFLMNRNLIHTEPFEDRINPEADYSAIDEDEVIDFLKKRAVKLGLNVPEGSIREILQSHLKVLIGSNGEYKPTNAALLFFSKQASDYIPHHEIRIARYDGVTRLYTLDSQELRGPIYAILKDIERFFKRNTRLANKIVDFKRVDIPEYSYDAVREAVINAIAHRDYNRLGAPIMFSIFDDRVEISNPGRLLPGLNINNLEGHHATRNQRICEIFHQTRDMEKYGTGIGKMKKLMREHGLEEPEFKEEGDFFVVCFYGPGENILNLVSSIPDERMVDLKELGLNDRQIEALKMMVNEGQIFTSALYQQIFKVSRRTATRDLNGLVESKMIFKSGIKKGTKYKANYDYGA